MKTVVLFGGTGFIGTHLSQHLLNNNLAERIFLVDVNPPCLSGHATLLQSGLSSGRVVFVAHDVRERVPAALLPETADVVFNLAAIHREPGHAAQEYFETNLLGAENVCAWAGEAGAKFLVFTSSISPYGPSEESKTEVSLPVPETAYGSSKLAAEKIHLGWQAADAGRKLLILRPGVVYGPGERGNVTRLVRSLVKGYFVYLGNQKTVKAAGYVKELCMVAMYGLEVLGGGNSGTLLLNFTLEPPPTVEEMVEAIVKVIGKRGRVHNVPARLLLGLVYPLDLAEGLFGLKLPINAVRVRKLIRSNNVRAEGLKSLGYTYRYTLESSFLDWKQDVPGDFAP